MQILTHRDFEKGARKMKLSEQKKLKQRLSLFMQDPNDPLLNNHALKGKYRGYRSINITGDVRALYEPIKQGVALFVAVGTHSELYD